MAPPVSSMRLASPSTPWTALLLAPVLLTILITMTLAAAPAAAQLNTDPWPTADGYEDVTEKYIPVGPSQYCDDVIGRYSFTQPGQVFQTVLTPAPPPNDYCRNPARVHAVGLVAQFQTSDFIPIDGMAGVWVGGVEVMRALFPKGSSYQFYGPDPRGTKKWTIAKSITQFLPLSQTAQTVKVSMLYDNTNGYGISNTLTPVINATFTLQYYAVSGSDGAASYSPIVQPISNSAADAAPWFSLPPGSSGSSTLTLPRNLVSASIEVVGVNAPGSPYNRKQYLGVDKQVVVQVDGVTAAFAYIGFVDADRLHEPLPLSYSVDITPFVGRLVDGNPHTFTLKNPHQETLLLSGNLFANVDSSVSTTSGTLLSAVATAPFKVVDYQASSNVTLKGSVTSSAGVAYTTVTQRATFSGLSSFSDCGSRSSLTLHVTQQTTHGSTPTQHLPGNALDTELVYLDTDCADVPCSLHKSEDDHYTWRRTRQGKLQRVQYHHTLTTHDDVDGGEYDCHYTESSGSEFVYQDFEKRNCFTYNTTLGYDNKVGTTTASVDSILCPPIS